MTTAPGFADVQSALQQGALRCEALTETFLARIRAGESLNAFVEVYADEALDAARAVDQKLQQGKAGPLAGLVLAVKDVICHRGHGLGASSKILEGFRSQFTATALQRLLDADAIVIGRVGCDEFAMGSSNESSCYGPVRNPYDPARSPGGSSGGSAAALAAGMCHAALGSDTGGSVRQPASFCGVVGLKPTYGRVSRWGLIAYASSFDQIGPLTQNVEDAALLLKHMAGPDGHDNTAASKPAGDYVAEMQRCKSQKFRIGYIREALESEGLDPEVRARAFDVLKTLRAQGHLVEEVRFPFLDYVVPCYYVLTTAEASSNLQRYDGVRYGYRAPAVAGLQALYRESRSQGFGPEVQRRILLGTFVLSAGYYDSYYTQAMKVRRMIRDHTDALLIGYDFLFTPTAPAPAFRLGEKNNDPVSMFLSDIYTVHANLAGMPAISVPCGLNTQGLPVGMQLMGRRFEEGKLLGMALQLQNGLRGL